LDDLLANWVMAQQKSEIWKSYIIVQKPNSSPTQIRIGTMALTFSVRRDLSELLDTVKKLKRKTIAVEMEAVGVFQAQAHSGKPFF